MMAMAETEWPEVTGLTAGTNNKSKVTVYAIQNQSWNPFNLYAWISGSDITTSWPGDGFGASTTSINGKDWQSRTLELPTNEDGTTYNIIFNNKVNNAGLQTGDITSLKGDVFFMQNSTDQTSFENKTDENIPNLYKTLGDISNMLYNSDCTDKEGWVGAYSVTSQTNYKGESQNVLQANNNDIYQKLFHRCAGKYVVQALVRGESGKTLYLNAGSNITYMPQNPNASVTLTGGDGGSSNITTNGTVFNGTNNGWQKIEVTTEETSNGILSIRFWSDGTYQVGKVVLLYNANTTDADSYQTMATTDATTTYVDETSHTKFSLFEQGKNKNCLIKATSDLTNNTIISSSSTCSNLVLTDGAYNFGNTGDAFTATNVKYDRTFTVANTSTICLPFALTSEEASAAGSFYSISGYNSGTGEVSFKKETNGTAANTPYIFVPALTNPFATGFTNKQIATTPASMTTTAISNLSLVGSYTNQTLKSTEGGTTLYGYSNGVFKKIGTTNGAQINPFRAYLSLATAAGGAKEELSLGFDGETTGINQVNSDKVNNSVFTIDGRLVNSNGNTDNLSKGIYIMNGKKITK